MRRSRYYWSFLSLLVLGIASAAVAQQPDGMNRSSGSPTLFDILQSRLRASGLTPAEDPQGMHGGLPQPHAAAVNHGGRAAPGPQASTRSLRASTNGPRALVETDLDVPGTPPLPVGTGRTQAEQSSSATSRMHQRLSAFRSSRFADVDGVADSGESQLDSQPEVTERVPHLADEGDVPLTPPGEFVGKPTLAPSDEPRVVGDSLPGARIRPQPQLASPAPKYASEVVPEETAVAEQVSPPAEPVRVAAPVDAPEVAAKKTRGADLSPQVLFTQQSPILNVKTVGPERIDVGREATFRVTIENLGSASADELIVAIDFPQWTELLGAEVSTGATTAEVAVDGTRLFRWKIDRLGAKDVQTVKLHVVARQSQPLNLAVNWQHAPVATAAKISVLQPDLQLKLDGPGEVLFGKKQLYRLELENTGTGDARGVNLSLLPLGTGQEKPAVQPIGKLAAGEKKTIEVELTARNEGDLVIQVDATADGNCSAHLSEQVRVLRPALAVDVVAPEFQFVGKEVTYRIVVTNPGTATAAAVSIEAALPETVDYVSSTKDGFVAEGDGRIRWSVDELGPQESRELLVKCVAASAGDGRLAVMSEAAGNVKAEGAASVQIDAIADLALEVTDPSGPVAVGTETAYQLKVENRGSKAAENVEIVAYFSHGIEPLGAEGGNHRLGPGQVVFDVIPSIGAGESKTYSVKARADATGNHIIRAEVFCKPLGTRLVGEESTYFYSRRGVEPTEAVPPRTKIAEEGVLTADQRGASSTETAEEPQE